MGRVLNVPEHIVLAGEPRRFDAPVARQHDDLHFGPDLFQLPQGLNAVHFGHLLIEHHDFRVFMAHDLDGVFAIVDIQHIVE
jgi:hypothetical protein